MNIKVDDWVMNSQGQGPYQVLLIEGSLVAYAGNVWIMRDFWWNLTLANPNRVRCR